MEEFFAAWARGKADFEDFLAENLTWTIVGTSPLSRVYTSRQDFLDNAIAEVAARLSKPIRPQVTTIVGENDVVVALWNGTATAKDGRPYENTYCWMLTLEEGRVVRATALFDTAELASLWERVSADDATNVA